MNNTADDWNTIPAQDTSVYAILIILPILLLATVVFFFVDAWCKRWREQRRTQLHQPLTTTERTPLSAAPTVADMDMEMEMHIDLDLESEPEPEARPDPVLVEEMEQALANKTT